MKPPTCSKDKPPALASDKERLGEKLGHIIPDGWPEKEEVTMERLVGG